MNKPGVVLVSWNHVSFTKLALKYILKNTSPYTPILIVDNGSDKETTDYLKSIEIKEGYRSLGRQHEISVIYNEKNLGIAPAMNQGMKWCLERGLDFCFVSNDIVVGAGWLKNLQEGVYKHEKIGGGSPYIAPEFTYDGYSNMEFRQNYMRTIWPRLVNDPSTEELGQILDELHSGSFQDFTENWSQTRKDDAPYFEWASMVMYIKKSTIEKVGLFDEQFVPSNHEDLDYMVRMNNAELYRIAVTGSYCFHWSNISNRNSFFDAPTEYRAEMTKNEQRFQDKWRVFKPHNERNHSVVDGDKYDFREAGPKLDEFFEVADKEHSRPHPKWWLWAEWREQNAKINS